MSYTLGDITLKRPIRMFKQPIETSAKHITLDGTIKKDISGRQWRYVLFFQYLTQAQVAQIISEYDLKVARNFTVSDGSLSIGPTSVHIELGDREYSTPGSEYRENLTLNLEEVS